MKIIISRTDKIGDVVLTLPLAGIMKENIPGVFIYFLGSSYTEAIVKRSQHVDEFLNWNEISKTMDLPKADCIIHVFPNKKVAQLAAKRNIKLRIGTSHRIFHWWTCNKLVSFTRKNSPLHEAQLNTKLLAPLGIDKTYSLAELNIFSGWHKTREKRAHELLTDKINVILHTKSKGSAMEWPLNSYKDIIDGLPRDKFQFFISGTADEGTIIRSELPTIFEGENVTDITGEFTLNSFIDFIEQCDGLLACSTGPLHIASISGIQCLGLYPSVRPMHAGRWGPIGIQSSYLEAESVNPNVLDITTNKVIGVLNTWVKQE
ncbi:MAG: glycosyltransferase family 9 protein [Cyclobacteriaceae bacterium]|nr:glycosyltransferase family 9 protein [Cyclobacteriaceae bacterium SS2]